MTNKHTTTYVLIFTISLVLQFVLLMLYIHPIKLRKQEKPVALSVSDNDKKDIHTVLYKPNKDDVQSELSLASMIDSYESDTVSPDEIDIPDDVTVKSVSNNDFKPGTYKIVANTDELGTIVIYSNGHVTVIKTDGLHKDYPTMTLSSDAFYASDINVKLQKQ